MPGAINPRKISCSIGGLLGRITPDLYKRATRCLRNCGRLVGNPEVIQIRTCGSAQELSPNYGSGYRSRILNPWVPELLGWRLVDRWSSYHSAGLSSLQALPGLMRHSLCQIQL